MDASNIYSEEEKKVNCSPDRSLSPSSLSEDSDLCVVVVPNMSGDKRDRLMEKAGAEVNKYLDEWNYLFFHKDYLSDLKKIGIRGKLRSCRFRSICWRLYLKCFEEDPSRWVENIRKSRNAYTELQNEHQSDPRLNSSFLSPAFNNPLSQEEHSPWNQYFQDCELKVTIHQDVVRTFPEIEYFHCNEVQEMMVSILFCYAREHLQISYKQGMHELLAPLIFVLYCDQQAFLHASEMENMDEKLHEILNPVFLEHDSYFMFCHVMKAVESWYMVRESQPIKQDHTQMQPFASSQYTNSCSMIVSKLTYIYDKILKTKDPAVYNHLEKMEIAPQIFGIRWLRLLFGREFPMQDLLFIWDAIFAVSPTFELVDHIFVAMLTAIRDHLLQSDFTSYPRYLVQYPPGINVHYIVDYAMHIYDPLNYSKPKSSAFSILHMPKVQKEQDIQHGSVTKDKQSVFRQLQKDQQGRKIVSGINSVIQSSRPKTLALNQSSWFTKTNKKGVISKKDSQDSNSSSLATDDYMYIEYSNEMNDLIEKTSAVGLQTSSSVPLGGKVTEMKPLHNNKSEGGMYNVKVTDPVNKPTSQLKFRFQTGSKRQKTREKKNWQEELENLQGMIADCSQQMSLHIVKLQEGLKKQSLPEESVIFVALAGLKQVRDILEGTLMPMAWKPALCRDDREQDKEISSMSPSPEYMCDHSVAEEAIKWEEDESDERLPVTDAPNVGVVDFDSSSDSVMEESVSEVMSQKTEDFEYVTFPDTR